MSDNLGNALGNIGRPASVPGQLKTYVVMVLDKSSSMYTGLQQTIDGFNEQLHTIQDTQTENNETLVSLVTFSHEVTEDIINQPADKIEELTEKTYVPRGMTALYDGVGTAIDRLLKQDDIEDENTSVLMVILSDGDENASKTYTDMEIAERIQRLKDTERWTFTYMGANVDLGKISETLNIDKGNIMSFDATNAAGYHNAKEMFKAGTDMYMTSRGVCGAAGPNGDVGFKSKSTFYSDLEDSSAE